MSAHGTPWRPLGVLLVEQGVISEAELETALAEQAASRKPLGEILIAHGFSSRPAIQDALAEQSGVLFEPERGFGTGLRGLLARKHRQRKGDAPSRPQLAVVPPLAEADAEVEAPPRRLAAGVASTDTRAGAGSVSGKAADARPENRVAFGAPGVNLLRPVERPQPAAPPTPPAPTLPAKPRFEVQLEELRTAQERTSGELTRIADALARVQGELAELRAAPAVTPPPVAQPEPEAASEPERAPEAPRAAPAPAVEHAHLRFVLAGAAYRIETHDGPSPAVGDSVEIGERSFRVVKVARSPLPRDERRCAYLLGE